ncbi:hypothetical protein NMG60_11006804 [Bertholletia excelsa]
MVLGLKTKNRKSPTVQLYYLIHIQEIKPWPPSQSLRTLRSVLIQWEHRHRNSGSTSAVVPLLGAGVGDGKIEFKESFRLPVTLIREVSAKGGDGDTFQRNSIDFNLYEPRRDKTGQLLGTATLDLADYGIVKEPTNITVPMNSKRSFKHTAQPVLFIKIQPIEKGRTGPSSEDTLAKEASMDGNGGESVSTLMNEEYAEEAEIASITDDDVSSHSSLAISSSAFETNDGALSPHREELKNGSQAMKDSRRETNDGHQLTVDQGFGGLNVQPVNEPHERWKDDKAATGGSEIGLHAMQLSKENKVDGSLVEVSSPGHQVDEKASVADSVKSQEDRGKVWNPDTEAMHEGVTADITHNGAAKDVNLVGDYDNGKEGQMWCDAQHSFEDEACDGFTQVDKLKQIPLGSDALSISGENPALNSNVVSIDGLRHVKSVRSPMEPGRGNGMVRNAKIGDAQNGYRGSKFSAKGTISNTSDHRIRQLERRIKMLEGELREAAAAEVGLYSVVAEHGSSINKVHAPARRLSRLYLHACRENSPSKKASAARSAVSGLVLVAKACGNDVPRLTFWLSNLVVLRAIISQTFAEKPLPLSAGPFSDKPDNWKQNNKIISPLEWKKSSPSRDAKGALHEYVDNWEDPSTFTSSLEKIEAWIFSRIVESIWWQTLTPYMQPSAARAVNTSVISNASKTYRRTSSSSDQEQVNLSLELWKQAFKDACERLCPVRAGGHECGCLPVLARLVMEQCVARLDVAMFNAILRESGEEIPTDPVSDPISDAKVLPIPAGKSSFGAGAQLKNAIGNWSRWLTDLFGIDDDDSCEDKSDHDNDENDEREDSDKACKSFYLLNALSDLMMLPKDMLLSRLVRKEVCPTFGTPLIKRILGYFVPDEFCPDPIPKVVLEALDYEDHIEPMEGSLTNFPCSAAPVAYSPPAASSVAGVNIECGSKSLLRRSGSSVLRKSYTSDDELEELDSPFASIIDGSMASPTLPKPSWISKENGSQNAIRYRLLREVWMHSE